MRTSLGIAAMVALVLLGALQVTASVTLRDRASAASWMHAAPAALVGAVASLEPHAYEPEELRRILGAAAVDRDLPQAVRFAASLRPGPERDVLAGVIAQARGDQAGAVASYLAAGDLTSLENRVDALAARHRVADAIDLERALLARLVADRAQTDTIAEATYRLGLLEQDRAYEYPAGEVSRDRYQHRSLDAYAEALHLAPLEERYGIALANQSLNVGDLAAARATFDRMRELDPASADPLTGLADTAIRAHDLGAARAYLDAADRLAPGSPAIAHLRARIPAE